MKVKEGSEKADLKLNIQKTKVMACSSITSWQINGKTMETVTGFIFSGSKITADSDCSQEIKRCLLLGRKGMTNKERIKRQRHYFAYKDLFSQSHGFSSSHVQMWELDNKKDWAPKNWCLETVVLEKTLDSPLDSKEIKPVNSKEKSTLNIHWKDGCWSWSSNNLTTWCEQLTHWKRPWCWERLKAGEKWDDRGWDGWMASLTQLTWV